jgi:hypothetical protein
MPNNKPGKSEEIHVSTVYGHNARKPIVQIEFRQEMVQMDVETARDLAQNILQAAEAALTDAFIFEFVEKLVGDSKAAAMSLIELRKFRYKKMQEEGK